MQNTILFLWPGAVPYQIRIYEQLAEWGNRVVVYNTEMDPTTPCFANPFPGVEYRSAVNLDYRTLLKQTLQLNPDIIITSGWHTKRYKDVCTYFKQKKGKPTICKIDSQFLHTWKQRIGFIVSRFIIKPSYSYMLVPGVRQYHFARRLGYDRQHILMYGLSADSQLFGGLDFTHKRVNFPKTFLFVARLVKVKGLEVLVNAWESITNKKGWNVVVVGSGPERARLGLDKVNGLICKEYMQQDELAQFVKHNGVYILPSIYEPWALTINEFAAAGMPLLCSEACGATSHLLINGYNGFLFKTGSVSSLKERMEQFMSMNDDLLFKMSKRSRNLANQFSPEFTAASILSVIS